MARITRRAYADMFGPTTGDRVRLADTDLIVEVEKRCDGCCVAGRKRMLAEQRRHGPYRILAD